jgi:sterol desaturase/sphingolipid hydroxylase (fatty acid hydroxylase superfamily)
MTGTIVAIMVGLAAAMLVSSLAEYIVHRLMHARKFLYKIHARHHQEGTGQGWFWEFVGYFVPGLPISIIGGVLLFWLYQPAAGIAFFAGTTLYASLVAYAHQVQHENPDLCFWLVRPVHHLHHHGKMWHHNFGIFTDVWDRVFGTYKPVEFQRTKRRRDYGLGDYLRIKWF